MMNAKNYIESIRRELENSHGDAFDRALEKPNPRKASAPHLKTMKSDWLDFCVFMKDNFSVTLIADVTVDHANKYISHIRAKGKWNNRITYVSDGKEISYLSGEQLSNNTLNAKLKYIKRIFKTLAPELGYRVEEHPFFNIGLLPKDTVPRDILTEEELRLIFTEPPPLIEGMFTIGICTGMREGDCATLRWSEIKNNFSLPTELNM